MRKKQRPYSMKLDGITYSLLTSWLTCRQQCRFQLEGWRSIRPKEAMSFGSLFHGMLHILYDHFRIGKTPTTMKGMLRSARGRVKPWIASYVEQESRTTSSPDFISMLERHAAVCEAILPIYLTQWEDDFRSREWLNLESEFDVVHPGGTPYRLRGKRDGVFRKTGKRGVWLLETKTKSRIDSDLVDALAVDAQNLFYMWATSLELGEMPIGVDYNVVRRPSIKQSASESAEEYAERAAVDMAARPETYFVRMEAAYDKADVLRFAEELTRKLAEFKQWSENPDKHTYRNESSCLSRWACDYLSACASGTMGGYIQVRRFSELAP